MTLKMQDQMVGQLGGYLCCSNTWSGTNSAHSIRVMPGMLPPGTLRLKKYMETFSKYKKRQILRDIIYAFACMIRAITMLRVADCYGPMPYSQVKKGNFYVSYDTQEQVYTSIFK